MKLSSGEFPSSSDFGSPLHRSETDGVGDEHTVRI